MEELIGKQLGQYRIEARIGQGAMATVFKAYQLSLDRYVAVKVLPPSFAAKNPVFIKRFTREAKSIARLHHPNILPVYDFGIDRDYSYIVMRYVEGAQTLSQAIYQPLSNEHKFDLIIQVASALAYAHKQGVIHRDVKPSNVLLDQGWALLADFGLAKVSESATRLTGTGKGIGTPAYMSPEQARGGPIDHRTDIYALGVMAFEILTKSIPHDADSALSILLKRTTEPPPSPRRLNPTISKRMEQVIIRSMAVKSEDRYSTGEHFISALKEAMAERSSFQTSSIESENKGTGVLASQIVNTLDSETDTLPEQPSRAFHYPFWLTGLGISLAIVALILWGGGVLSSAASQNNPTQIISIADSTPTPTDIPTSAPVSTSTNTPLPPTITPSPSSTPTPTDTLVAPTATPLVVIVTATSTSTPTTEPTPTVSIPTATPTVITTPTPSLPNGEFVLLNPLSLDEPSYGPTDFEWEWGGPVPPDFGFEVRVWREGEPPAGAHDAVMYNQQGRIEQIGENRYHLNIDIREAFGVQGRTGEYLWTVALVQISPEYADLGQQAKPAYLRFEAGGGNGGGNDSGGGAGGLLD